MPFFPGLLLKSLVAGFIVKFIQTHRKKHRKRKNKQRVMKRKNNVAQVPEETPRIVVAVEESSADVTPSGIETAEEIPEKAPVTGKLLIKRKGMIADSWPEVECKYTMSNSTFDCESENLSALKVVSVTKIENRGRGKRENRFDIAVEGRREVVALAALSAVEMDEWCNAMPKAAPTDAQTAETGEAPKEAEASVGAASTVDMGAEKDTGKDTSVIGAGLNWTDPSSAWTSPSSAWAGGAQQGGRISWVQDIASIYSSKDADDAAEDAMDAADGLGGNAADAPGDEVGDYYETQVQRMPSDTPVAFAGDREEGDCSADGFVDSNVDCDVTVGAEGVKAAVEAAVEAVAEEDFTANAVSSQTSGFSPEEVRLLVKLRELVQCGRVSDEETGGGGRESSSLVDGSGGGGGMGSMGGISDDEWSVIFACDQTMVKFMRAREGDLDAAAAMCLQHLRWRTNFQLPYDSDEQGQGAQEAQVAGLSEILRRRQWSPPPVFDRFIIRSRLERGHSSLPQAPLFFGRDHNGHLVSFARVGLLDLAGIYERLGEEELLSCFSYCLEHTRQALLRHWKESGVQPQLTTVVDLDGFGQHCVPPMSFLQKLLGMFQDNFPEVLRRAVVVRAPWLFFGVWQVVSSFLNEAIREKIVIHSGNECIDEIAAELPLSSIPGCFGGEMEWEGDSECAAVLSPGGFVEQEDEDGGFVEQEDEDEVEDENWVGSYT
jgi:hypothetical protein